MHHCAKLQQSMVFSYPAIAPAILYVAFTICLLFVPEIFKGIFQAQSIAETAFAAFAFGLANGIVRERCHSFPAIVFRAIAFAAMAFFSSKVYIRDILT